MKGFGKQDYFLLFPKCNFALDKNKNQSNEEVIFLSGVYIPSCVCVHVEVRGQ